MHPEYDIVLVLSTDQPLISKETITSIIKKHKESKPAITMGTIIVPDYLQWRAGMMNFGRIIRSADGTVEKNVEFKDATDAEKGLKEVNPAIYCFDRQWLWGNINALKNDNAQGEYYLTDLIGLARSQGKSVEAVPVANIMEGIQPNSKQELALLEELTA